MNLWKPDRFEECLDRWIDTRAPGEDSSIETLSWPT